MRLALTGGGGSGWVGSVGLAWAQSSKADAMASRAAAGSRSPTATTMVAGGANHRRWNASRSSRSNAVTAGVRPRTGRPNGCGSG